MKTFDKYLEIKEKKQNLKESTTTDMSKFGYREVEEASKLLNAWVKNGLPDDFDNDGVKLMMNQNSGNVFLTNNDYQVAMVDKNKLYSFYNTPYDGHEGSAEDLVDMYDDMNEEDQEYVDDIVKNSRDSKLKSALKKKKG